MPLLRAVGARGSGRVYTVFSSKRAISPYPRFCDFIYPLSPLKVKLEVSILSKRPLDCTGTGTSTV
jgi:hypothetical protein